MTNEAQNEQFLTWLRTHQDLTQAMVKAEKEMGRPNFSWPVVQQLVYVNIEGHERFGQIGVIDSHDWRESGDVDIIFPQGAGRFHDSQFGKGLEAIMIPLLTDQDKVMLAEIQPGVEKFFPKEDQQSS